MSMFYGEVVSKETRSGVIPAWGRDSSVVVREE